MRFTVLGSCSGTEPMPGRHQTSVALEVDGKLYFLDAGENCGYASYLLGIDQRNTQAVFISHTHMDHVGGLPHFAVEFAEDHHSFSGKQGPYDGEDRGSLYPRPGRL